jgi:hypothetical protein
MHSARKPDGARFGRAGLAVLVDAGAYRRLLGCALRYPDGLSEPDRAVARFLQVVLGRLVAQVLQKPLRRKALCKAVAASLGG